VGLDLHTITGYYMGQAASVGGVGLSLLYGGGFTPMTEISLPWVLLLLALWDLRESAIRAAGAQHMICDVCTHEEGARDMKSPGLHDESMRDGSLYLRFYAGKYDGYSQGLIDSMALVAH
jgi:hypothetical protein